MFLYPYDIIYYYLNKLEPEATELLVYISHWKYTPLSVDSEVHWRELSRHKRIMQLASISQWEPMPDSIMSFASTVCCTWLHSCSCNVCAQRKWSIPKVNGTLLMTTHKNRINLGPAENHLDPHALVLEAVYCVQQPDVKLISETFMGWSLISPMHRMSKLWPSRVGTNCALVNSSSLIW